MAHRKGPMAQKVIAVNIRERKLAQRVYTPPNNEREFIITEGEKRALRRSIKHYMAVAALKAGKSMPEFSNDRSLIG
jgi:hypothetical protein